MGLRIIDRINPSYEAERRRVLTQESERWIDRRGPEDFELYANLLTKMNDLRSRLTVAGSAESLARAVEAEIKRLPKDERTHSESKFDVKAIIDLL